MNGFSRLAPFIQDYIYQQGWKELRDVQEAACRTIFDTDHNLLLSSGTASGKTEAAFLPALTELWKHPSRSVGIVYISPLKALINDQFERLDDLLKASGIPVCRWHGDASESRKRALEENPEGVLQITPESLESLVMRKSDVCREMFADTRFIVIDEVHAFMSGPRGSQLICLINRIARLTGVSPRRIGLSATLSDRTSAAEWLSAGSGRACDAPECPGGKKRVRVRMSAFPRARKADMYGEIYGATLGRRSILFANSRGETEEAAAALKSIARQRGTPDVYRVHHGSLSAALRHDTEKEMKEAEGGAVTCATVTLELGIDIGRLDSVVQMDAPFTVSSLVQRMGRCGRRGQAAELLFMFPLEEDEPVPWELVKGTAILELYRTERWTEPGRPQGMDMSLLFQQTLSELYAGGEVKPARLAERILTLPPFGQVGKDDYAALLRSLIRQGFVEKTERGGLILGTEGERLCGHYDFFSAFEAAEETEVRCGAEIIGTVTGSFQRGDTLRLAGRCWRVLELSDGRLYVEPGSDAEVVSWDSLAGAALHGTVVRKMREVLAGGEEYPYMTAACRESLAAGRAAAGPAVSGWAERDRGVDFYPWMDSRQLLALSLILPGFGFSAEILPSRRTPVYLGIGCQSPDRLRQALRRIALGEGEPRFSEGFVFPGKYTRYIPRDLAEKAYIAESLDTDGMREALGRILEEQEG